MLRVCARVQEGMEELINRKLAIEEEDLGEGAFGDRTIAPASAWWPAPDPPRLLCPCPRPCPQT